MNTTPDWSLQLLMERYRPPITTDTPDDWNGKWAAAYTQGVDDCLAMQLERAWRGGWEHGRAAGYRYGEIQGYREGFQSSEARGWMAGVQHGRRDRQTLQIEQGTNRWPRRLARIWWSIVDRLKGERQSEAG